MFSHKSAILSGWRFLLLLAAYIMTPATGTAEQDLTWLDLSVRPDFTNRSIRVTCVQHWIVAPKDSTIRLLLDFRMQVDSVLADAEPAVWQRDSTGLWVYIPRSSRRVILRMVYHGSPVEAPNPPWNGGFIWKTDSAGKPWLTTALQDKGAQVWWPAPERYNEKPDSLLLTCTYPADLFFKGNGRLAADYKQAGKLRTTSWRVSYPIAPANVTLNIGDYVHFSDTLLRPDGTRLALDYYPLRGNLEKARNQFRQTKPMLNCFESYFGSYPYERDGFSIVESPYAGMEHQGAIAYGNGYVDGYGGEDYSAIGLNFDFILIHESAHQWWGNSVSAKTPADFWLQEAFCTYAEYIYVSCRYGERTADRYINAKKRLVENKEPVYGAEGGIDMYAKGALVLYTLQHLVGDEGRWQDLLLRFATGHRHASLTTEELIRWFSLNTGRNLEGFFRQYLRHAELPQLEIRIEPKRKEAAETEEAPEVYIVFYRVNNAETGFQLPVNFRTGSLPGFRTVASGAWQEWETNSREVEPDPDWSYFSLKKN